MHRLCALALLALPLPALSQEAGEAPAAEEEGGFLSRLFGRDDEEETAAEIAAEEEDDEGFLTRFIEERLSATARNVDVQGFAGALSSRATIERLTIADGEGVWLRAEDLALQWDRSELLGGRIEVEELTAGSIEVLRAPVPDPETPRPEATPFSLPELPVSLEIGQLRSDRIVLGETLLGEELVLALEGAINLENGEGTANVAARIVEGSEGQFSFAGGYSNETRILSVNLDLEEAEGGLAARALRIPGLPSIALRVEGTAPIDDYEATLDIATDGEERIAGTFALQTTEEPGEGYVVERAFGLDVRGDVTPLLAPAAGRFFGTDVVLRTKGIRRSDGSLVLTSLGIRGEAINLNGGAEITPEGWPARLELAGRIGVEEGTPVPLPGAADTTVRGVALEVAYDREQGESWTGTFDVEALERAGLSIEALSLQGGGTIQPATAEEEGRFSADLAYEAQGLAFDQAGIGEALGADLSGDIDLVRVEDGGPLRISRLNLSGPGIEAQAEGTVGGPDTGFLAQSSIQLEAEDLARFAALTGLDLGGAADVTIVSAVRPLDGIFDLVLSGSTENLALGVEPLDPLLAGSGEVSLNAARDETGLRVSTLSVETDAVIATGQADLTSGASQARFDLDIADLGLSFPALSGPGTIQGSFDRNEDGAGTLDAQATLPGATLALDAEIGANVPTARPGEEAPGLVTFTAEAAVEELSDYEQILETFAPDLPVTPAGAVDLTLSGTTELDADLFDVTVDARTRDLALGQDAFDAAFAGEGRLAGRLIRTGFDALRVEDLAIDTPVLDGTLTADLGEGTGSADLDLRLTEVGPVLGGLSGPGEVSGTATRAADGSTDIDLDLRLPTGTAQVDGTLAALTEGSAFTGDLALDFEDIAPLGTLLGRDLAGAVQGTASGTLRSDLSTLDLAFDATTQDLRLDIPQVDRLIAGDGTFRGRAARDGDDLRLEDVEVETDLLSGAVSAAIEDGVGSADLDLALVDVAPVLGGLEGPGRVTGTAQQAGNGTTDLHIQATLPTGTANVDGTLAGPEEDFAFTGDIEADFSDIAPLGPLVGRDLAGALQGTASGTVRPDLTSLDLAFDAATSNLRLGVPALDALLQGDGTLRGRAERDSDDLRLEDLALETDLLSGTVTAAFEDGQGSADLDLSLPDVAPVLGGLSGPGRVTGTATGAGDGTVDLDLQATLPTGTASVDGILDLEDDRTFTGNLAADFEDIAPLGTLVGRDLAGALRGTATGTVRADLSALDLAFDATTRDLALGLPQIDPFLAGEGTLSGRAARDEGDLRLEDVAIETDLVTGTVTASIEDGVGSADLDFALVDVAPVLGGLSGPGRITGTARQTGNGTTVLDLAAELPTGTVQVEGTLDAAEGNAFTGDLALDFEDVSPLGRLLGRDLAGAVAGTASGTLRLDLSTLDLAFDATTRDLVLGIPQIDSFLAGEGTVRGRAARDGDDLRLEDVAIETDLVTGTVSAAIEDGVGSADLDLALADVAPVLGGLPGPGRIRGTARQAGDGTTALDLEATLPTGTAQVEGTLDPAEGNAFAGGFVLDFEDVAPLGRLLGRDLAGAVDATATGTVRADLSTLDLDFEAATSDLRLGVPALDALLEGEGRFTGRAERTGPTSFRVEDLALETDFLTGTVSAAFEDGQGSAELDLSLPNVAPVLGGLEGPGRITGTASGSGDGTVDLDLQATLPTGTASVDGTLDLEEGRAFTGDLAADFEDIAPLGTLLGRDLAGAFQGTASGTVRADLAAVDLAFEATTRDLQLDIPQLDPFLAGEGTLSGRAARDGDDLSLEDIVIETNLVTGTVSAAIEDGVGSADLDLALANVAPILGGLEGPGTVTGTARQTGNGTTDLDLQATLPTGTASVDGILAGLDQGFAFTGDLAADFTDIAPLGPLLDRDLGGGLSGAASGTLRPDLSVLDLTFDVSTQDLRLGLPLLDPLLAGPGAFAGTVSRSEEGDLALDLDADTPQLRGDVDGTFGQGTGEGRFDLALADLGLIAPGLSGPAAAVGEASRAPDGSIAIDAQASGPGLSAVIDATVAPPDQGSEISGTADVALADLSPLAPLLGRPLGGGFEGTITGTALPSLASFDLAVDGTAQNLALGNPSLDLLFAGTGAVSARLSRTEGSPVAIESLAADFPNFDLTAQGATSGFTFTADLADAALFAPPFPGAISATGTGSIGADGLVVDAAVTGPGGLSTQVTGPLGPITDLRLVGTGPLALFNGLLDPRRLNGTASFDLGLTGPSLEALAGTVTTQGASLADPTLGEAVRNIAGTATLAGGFATLDLTGNLATGGRLSVTGPVGIVSPFDADLVVVGQGLVVRDPALYEAFGDARLTVTGSLEGGALIAGVADLSRVEGRVPASDVSALGDVPRVFHIEPSLPVVETLRRAGLSPSGEDITPETGEARGGGVPYNLDILLRAPSQVFIRGRGLDAELGGELRLTGTTTDVIPLGQFSLIRGRLDILGQRFELTEGSGTLQGDFNPFIRVVAETEARTGTEIRVVVEGPLISPTVSFESTPELPEDEVLAQLLFGVDIESITPLQAVRLASAVATLAGEGTGLIDDLRGGIGLADFDVTTTESGNIALRLGRYLSENVYTDVIVSTEETEATINLDLSPDLTVRAGVSTRGDTTLGIFFERDY